jgi:hypothetical protein
LTWVQANYTCMLGTRLEKSFPIQCILIVILKNHMFYYVFKYIFNDASGWKHSKRRHGCQGKGPFPRTTNNMSLNFCWFIILKNLFWTLNLTLHVICKYILITNWFYIFMLCIYVLYHININNFLLKSHFQNP